MYLFTGGLFPVRTPTQEHLSTFIKVAIGKTVARETSMTYQASTNFL